uniref:Uncharacterized protein n=1 Tax=Candidatus Kentrum sp. UNK TaxID=2126344 RepID=A0A451AI16_9GAMM|nr:MAG: hypothetical protein BECKUNK1418G_GA0071005_106813 [Candidatus Kentron sp. UNK]VFK72535.1 MAG: hypothetical protein BECKUNK1418H_GA0071006_112013 [Candidatus Kentron sp. UNK]
MRFAYPPYGPESGLLFHSNTRYSQTLIKAAGALPRIEKADVRFGDERE